MHLPKFALRCGKLSSLCGRLGFRVYLRQRKVAKHKPQNVAKLLLNLLDGSARRCAMRALVVSIFDQCQGRVLSAHRMILWPHRYLQRTRIVFLVVQCIQCVKNSIRDLMHFRSKVVNNLPLFTVMMPSLHRQGKFATVDILLLNLTGARMSRASVKGESSTETHLLQFGHAECP